MVKKALEMAYSKPNAKVKYGTAFQTDLLEFILPAFDIVSSDCPDGLRPVWKSQKSKFILPHNGSEIKLVGLDRKPNGLRGNVIDLIILDEAGFMSRLDYLYKSVIIPATTHRPDCRVLMFSTPPETPAHEFLDFVQKAEVEGGHLKLTIYDNPLVDSATIKRLMEESGGEESTTWKREYLCEHITDANLCVVPEWKDEYVQEIPRDDYYPYYHRYVSLDLGVRDHTAAIFGYYDFRRAKLIIEDEYVINGPELTTNVLAAGLSRVEDNLWKPFQAYRRVSDNNNPLLLQDLASLHKLSFYPTDKGRLDEMVNTVRMMVRRGSIIVHPRCKHVKGCLKYGVWDKQKDKFARSKVYGHFDALASLIYLVRNLNTTTNPIPIDFGLDRNNQLLFNKSINSQAGNELKSAFTTKR